MNWGDALIELAWVLLVLGGPVLAAVLWKNHQEKKKQKRDLAYNRFIFFSNHPAAIGYRERQSHKDAENFKKIEEARNDFA